MGESEEAGLGKEREYSAELRLGLVEVWHRDRRWVLLRLLCAVIWAGELFRIQQIAFAVPPWIRFPLLTQEFRLYLDVVVTLAMVFLVRRRYLTPLLICNALMLAAIGTYVNYFHWPPMPARIMSQWQEGWSFRVQLWEIVPWQTLGLAAAAFALKFCLLVWSGRNPLAPWARRRVLVMALAAYVLPVAGLQLTFLRLSVGPSGGMGRAVYTYGYLLPWVCDTMGNRGLAAHAKRAQTYLTHNYDRITPLEAPLRVTNHIVVLQLEAFGGSAIEAVHEGRPVMPFLRGTKESSMYFRIQAFHRIGSCDMDYAATTFVEPYPGVMPYRLPGMVYTNSMPEFMKRYGYATYIFHGNSSLIYERGPVVRRLGFDHVLFKEQLAGLNLPESVIGIRDRAVLNQALQVLRTEKRAYVFGITLDTHAPFKQLQAGEMEIFPQPANPLERYMNSLRYLDKCLREFVNGLPPGTTVVFYGDHTAALKSEWFCSDVVDGNDYVSCLVYQAGSDLAACQRTRQQAIAEDGSLNLLDVLSYLRHSVMMSNLH